MAYTTLYSDYTNIASMQSTSGGVTTNGYLASRNWFSYDVVTNNNTTYGIKLKAGFEHKAMNLDFPAYSHTIKVTLAGTDKTSKNGSKTLNTTMTVGTHSYTTIAEFTSWTWTKTHKAQTVTIKVSGTYTASGKSASLKSKSKTFTIPAKPSYTISYNLNGGTGTISDQTKWYGETLTLSKTVPTKTGTNIVYTFKGWATSQTNANNKVVAYKAGASYTANSAQTLYAVWDIAHKAPTVGRVTAKRADSNGDPADEGTYMNLSFPWSVDRSGYTNTKLASVTVEYKLKSASTWSTLSTYTTDLGTGETGTFSVTGVAPSGGFATNSTYSIRATVADDKSGSTVIENFLSSAFFIIDVSQGGYGMGLGTVAPETNGSGDPLDASSFELHLGGITRAFRSIFFEDALGYVTKGLSAARINAESYNGTNNMYYRVPGGYHAFYAGNNNANSGGIMYVYDDHVKVFGPIDRSTETPTISISTSTGTLDSYTIRKDGDIVFLRLTIYNNSSVAAGGNIFTGTIGTTGLRPVSTATGGSYWGSHAIGVLIGTDGAITVRNASSSAFTPNSSNKATISLMYMV